MSKENIQENTIDFSAHIYDSPHFDAWRYSVKTSPDFPDVVVLSYEEFNEESKGYVSNGEISFDLETWNKIQHAVDVLFKNNK